MTSKVVEFKAMALEDQAELIVKQDKTPYKVLLAEDSEVNQLMASNQLKGMGCEVDIAKDGESVIAKAKKTHYDIIFMDCKMPITDGYQATKAIRDYEKVIEGRHIPIVALTAKVLQGDRELCMKAGMDDYLTKPVRKQHLIEMINKWCANYVDFADVW